MKSKRLFITQLVLCFCIFGQALFAQTTEFTYQGSMKNSSVPANGNFDFEFALYDALSGGIQVGSVVALNNVAVANGIFSVKLDFGNQFTGPNRYLEIRVRLAGQPGITTLGPRQLMNSTPYSVKSLDANNATTAINATQLGGIAASGFIQNTTTQQAASNFNVSGTGRAATIDAIQYNWNGQPLIRIGGSVLTNLSVGRNTGTTVSSGEGNSFFGTGAGSGNKSGGSNTFLGSAAGNSNTSGGNNTVVGSFADVGSGNLSFATAIGSGATVSQSSTVVLGRSADIVRVPGIFAAAGNMSTNGNLIVLGNGTVVGTLDVPTLGSAGSTNVCRNASNALSTCSSSLRYKTNIGQFSLGLSFVNKLRPITFDWKDGGMKDVGFGAEDIAKIDPRFVTYNEKGEVEGVKYDRLSVAFVNAFKEQQTQIEEQQKQINELKMIVCSLKPEAAVCGPKGK